MPSVNRAPAVARFRFAKTRFCLHNYRLSQAENIMSRNYRAPSLFALAIAITAAMIPATAQAQDWPQRQVIKIISPYAPGGTTDVLARLLAPKLQEILGQSVIVENHPGAGGNNGTDFVAKSPANGYTLLLAASGPVVIAPSLYPRLPYDSLKDFTFIAPIADASFVVVANANAGINSIRDLIRQGKQSGKLNFGSSGTGTPQHIIGEMFNVTAGTRIQHIPYNGSGPLINALLSEQVQIAFDNPISEMPHVKSGKLKVLAVTGAQRSPVFPDIPTLAESGLPGFDAKPWYGLMGPANLDPQITKRLNAAMREILGTTDIKARIFVLGGEPMSMSPAEFRAFAATELVKWTKAVKASGATVD
jgi:tripartite-type tricarboxylate transporter receptor subunit TctC